VLKKLLFIFIFLIASELSVVTTVSYSQPFDSYCDNPVTYEDFYIEKIFRLTKVDQYVLYVLEQCKKENVDPLEMISILQIENPVHKVKALNINYVKVWDRKLKKFILKESSRDIGLFQLNNKCFNTFIQFYWDKYNEKEKFDPYNYKHNTRIAVRLHKANKKLFNGSQYYSVLAYNTGSGNVQRATVNKRTAFEYWPKFKKNYSKMY
jgi:hypothetical protein